MIHFLQHPAGLCSNLAKSDSYVLLLSGNVSSFTLARDVTLDRTVQGVDGPSSVSFTISSASFPPSDRIIFTLNTFFTN